MRGATRRSSGLEFARRFSENRAAVLSLAFILLLALLALAGQWIMPYDPNEQDLQDIMADPFSGGHLLGTDELGRDTLSRLIAGASVALGTAAIAVGAAALVGVPPGLIAGSVGGRIDALIMRLTDTLQSFPPLIVAIAVVGIVGPGLRNSMAVVGVLYSPALLRVVRGTVLEVREEAYVEASRSIGTSPVRIALTRVFPNALPPLLVQLSLAAGFALLAEASLSFLGLGVQLPHSSWGRMLGRGYESFEVQPWLIVFPGVAIALTVLAFNLIGDGIRDSIGREVRGR